MTIIKTIQSGSAGNCHLIIDSEQILMIECGLTLPAIRQGIKNETGALLTDCFACLISHDHGDHAKSASKIMAAGIDCYMTERTRGALRVSGHRLKTIEPLKQFSISEWKILPFQTIHDAADPVGFLIMTPGGSKILFATDTAYLKYKFQGLTHILIEANYCPNILEENIRSSEYPRAIRNRVVKSHMSLQTTIETLKSNDLSNVREIRLIHLSRDNSNPEYFKKKVQEATGKPVYI